MSSDMTEFDSYDIGTEEIINILKAKIKNEIIINKVIKINNLHRQITLENGEILSYNNLISTIPMNVFLYLNDKIEVAKQFKSFPTTFILVENDVVNDFKDYTYVYFSEPQYPFHRITQLEHSAVFEFKGDDIRRFPSESNRFVQKVGQLIQNDIKIDIKYVEFFGRYGCWKHGILVNDLLKQIYERNQI
jgi:protoporphyrinogen oxidase